MSLQGNFGQDEGTSFSTEKVLLLRHLLRIQRETGWKTDDRAKDLRLLWGLE